MSIALSNRVKDLERRLSEVESLVDVLRAQQAKSAVVQAVDIYPSNWGETSAAEAMATMPAKRKPGRPPKNG